MRGEAELGVYKATKPVWMQSGHHSAPSCLGDDTGEVVLCEPSVLLPAASEGAKR